MLGGNLRDSGQASAAYYSDGDWLCFKCCRSYVVEGLGQRLTFEGLRRAAQLRLAAHTAAHALGRRE